MTIQNTNRRNFLRGLGVAAVMPHAFLASATMQASDTGSQVGESLSPWEPGMLDIHHISTGRGSCAFLLCPDGTSLMVDAGALQDQPETRKYEIEAKPDSSRRPGEWIARYVQSRMQPTGRDRMDYFVLTHLHEDHMGGISPASPRSSHEDYLLTGISDVAEQVTIGKIIDRAFPSYSYPVGLNNPSQKNYRAFLASFQKRGGQVERIHVGSNEQIRLLHEPEKFPSFFIRNLAANGEVWTGRGATTRNLFPPLDQLSPDDYPTENKCSLAIRLSYGDFDYFSAGDMDHDTRYGTLSWGDIETPVAQVAGPVDVAVANHHGYANACGPDWVRALRPRAFVINAWDSAHPTMPALDNMLSKWLYPGERDVYATAMKPENRIATRQIERMKSLDGHVVFRVMDGGSHFSVNILANSDETFRIKRIFGPYSCG